MGEVIKGRPPCLEGYLIQATCFAVFAPGKEQRFLDRCSTCSRQVEGTMGQPAPDLHLASHGGGSFVEVQWAFTIKKKSRSTVDRSSAPL